MNQAMEVCLNDGQVNFEPVKSEVFIGKGTLYTCPDGSEVWELYNPKKIGLPKYVENCLDVWEIIFM